LNEQFWRRPGRDRDAAGLLVSDEYLKMRARKAASSLSSEFFLTMQRGGGKTSKPPTEVLDSEHYASELEAPLVLMLIAPPGSVFRTRVDRRRIGVVCPRIPAPQVHLAVQWALARVRRHTSSIACGAFNDDEMAEAKSQS